MRKRPLPPRLRPSPRLGLGPEECLARNPKLVYGRMTGWGQDGPWATVAGHDVAYLAVTGVLHAIEGEREPVIKRAGGQRGAFDAAHGEDARRSGEVADARQFGLGDLVAHAVGLDHGGKHVQFNVVSKEMLLKAQQNPAHHRDLVVRVAGYSAYFVQLNSGMQDEVIARTELSLAEM